MRARIRGRIWSTVFGAPVMPTLAEQTRCLRYSVYSLTVGLSYDSASLVELKQGLNWTPLMPTHKLFNSDIFFTKEYWKCVCRTNFSVYSGMLCKKCLNKLYRLCRLFTFFAGVIFGLSNSTQTSKLVKVLMENLFYEISPNLTAYFSPSDIIHESMLRQTAKIYIAAIWQA